MSTKQVRISDESVEKLDEIKESTLGKPSYRSLVDEAIEEVYDEINEGE